MKRLIAVSLFSCCFFSAVTGKGYEAWQKYSGAMVPTKGEQRIAPRHYQVFSLQESNFKDMLFSLPGNATQAQVIDLPAPDGTMKSYRVWQTPMMEDGLAEKYPGIKTFTGYAEGNQRITVKIDFTYTGFHAMVMDGANTYFINPYSDVNDGYYICYFKKDLSRDLHNRMACGVEDDLDEADNVIHLTGTGLPELQYRMNGTSLKSYRLALACSGEYAVAVAGPNPTKAAVLSAMVTSINRINGVYERELAVTLNLIAGNDTLIHLVEGFDAVENPYSNSNGNSMLNQNQNIVTQRIGTANYDIGHVFSTDGGGVATLGCVCKTNSKAEGVTGQPNPVGDGFDIDYVAHEMGHQFGANHTFNANTGSCNNNGSSQSAYEPGGGTTIMAYAGICTGNDIQQNSNDYFHAKSLDAISIFINYAAGGAACDVEVPTNNTPPALPAFGAIYQIPERTPFELTAPEVQDADHDNLTYCWEQWNRGDYRSGFNATRVRGPIFRSFPPTASRTRVFPVMSKVLAGITSYMGEKVPDTTRYLTFKLTVRDMLNGVGSFNFADDTVHLDVTELSGPFTVTSQSSAVSVTGGSMMTVTWNVANTDQAPVSCSNVAIYMSDDGGVTWPYILSSGTANDGSEEVYMPNIQTTTKARVKVKGLDNVFFNVNATNFTVMQDPTNSVANVSWKNDVTVFPVPAGEQLQIENRHTSQLQASIVNTLGQQVWSGSVKQQATVPVGAWAPGVYYLQMLDARGEKLVKPVVIQ